MAITTQFLTGFEHGFIGTTATAGGGLFDTVTAGVTASTSAPRNGGYCAHLVAPVSTITRVGKNLTGSPTKVVIRCGVKVTSRPSASSQTLIYCNTNSVVMEIDNTGQLLTSGSVAGPTLDTTNWHLIEVQMDTVAQTLDWKVDGVAQTRAATIAVPVTAVGLGVPLAGSQAFTADFDDWIVGAWTNAATDWYGDGKVLSQQAGVDGTHATITSLSPGDAGTAYSGTPTTVNTMVDDPPGTLGWTATRSTTDNIALRTATASAYANIGPATTAETGSANAVRALLSYSSVTATANLAACDVRNSAGTVNEIWGLTGGVGKDFSESTNFFKGAIVTVPAAGWTAAEVNAIRWRFGGCTSVDVSPIPTCQALMLEVDWPAAAASLDLSAATGLATFVGSTANVQIGARTFPNMVAMAPASH